MIHNDIKQYIEELYPAADEEEVSNYVYLVLTHDTNKLPPTPIVLDYIEVKKQLKELESREAALKAKIIEQYKRLNHQFSGLSISTPTPRRYDPQLLLNWAMGVYEPSFFDDCKSTIIDKDKVEDKIVQLIVEEKIKQEDIPEDLIKQSSQTRIEVSGSRKRKD